MTHHPIVAVYGSARIGTDDPRFAAARALGGALAQAGLTVATGGYQGVMAAISRGAHDAGGEVIGYTVSSWDGLPANEWVTREVDSADLFERLRLFSKADLMIALDGGIGTLTEVAVSWNLLQVGSSAQPLLMVGDEWAELVDFVARRLVVAPEDLALVRTLPSGTSPSTIVAEARALIGRRLGLGGPWESARPALR
ncbi:MAG: hypothetical protein DWI45_01990 [Chloroflexi bacterium]|nr:MAG: hypothetical protein DWI45_01990 [Chloroflexota bacterium]